jgi:hypothetical protein
MNLLNKISNRILVISGLFLIFTIGISFLLLSFDEPKYLGCATEIPQNFCGTVSPNLNENVRKGKQIFNANCASCHMLNKNITGPALAKTDSTLLWNWLTIKNRKIDSTKFNEIGIDYHRIQWGEILDSTEIENLYKYTNAE